MKFLESFLPKLFITLIPTSEGVLVSGELRKRGVTLKRFEAQIINDTKVLQAQMKKFERESSLLYVSFLETEADQGLLTSCNASAGVDLSTIEKILTFSSLLIRFSTLSMRKQLKRVMVSTSCYLMILSSSRCSKIQKHCMVSR